MKCNALCNRKINKVMLAVNSISDRYHKKIQKCKWYVRNFTTRFACNLLVFKQIYEYTAEIRYIRRRLSIINHDLFMKVLSYYSTSSLEHMFYLKESLIYCYRCYNAPHLKLPPNPRLCCKVWANISYFLMSLSVTDRRANFMASSKWSRLISGTGSSMSSS